MQLTAIGTVAVTILLLGTFMYVRESMTQLQAGVLNKIEISVYLKDDVDDAKARDLSALLAADRRIAEARYVPRADGLREMVDRLKGQIDMSLLTSNPLPNAFRVRVVDPDQVHAVAAKIATYPQVAQVDYAQDVVRRLLRSADMLGRAGLAMIGLLLLTAAIIIANTIRLTVFARRREIAIMQLVGATNMYIRWPFMVEGLIAGRARARPSPDRDCWPRPASSCCRGSPSRSRSPPSRPSRSTDLSPILAAGELASGWGQPSGSSPLGSSGGPGDI